ncbi:NUDIX domain-containing protein [Candidatus Microgenomates bacterium]|nr:NUDIX domain-containing protein [Candidatus Microgenomates bacterium]
MEKIKTTLKISLAKAKKEKLFYFVVTGVIYHPRLKKCLILKRSRKEVAHPGLWGVIGGKLEWSDLKNNPITRKNFDILDWEDLLEKLVKREAKEECGLEVSDLRYLDNVVYLRPDNVPTVAIKFAVKYKSGKVTLAPEFDEYAWVDGREVKKFKCIRGIPREVRRTGTLYAGK